MIPLWFLAMVWTTLLSSPSCATHQDQGRSLAAERFARALWGAPPSGQVYRVSQPSHAYAQPDQPARSHNPVYLAFQPTNNYDQSCYKPPAYLHYNISNKSYYYPRNNIFQELHNRKDILEKIFKSGTVATIPSSEIDSLFSTKPGDLQSSVGDGVISAGNAGCVGYRLLLRSFDSYGGRCWVVYPRHQAVSYLTCGSASKCQGGYGQHSTCAVDERTDGVWAWCETLPLGKRITKVYLPLPVACRCKPYNC